MCAGGTPVADESAQLRGLIERARNGDADAFERLYERFEPSIYGLCWMLLDDRDGAADAAQEAFVGAWRQIRRLQHPAAFAAWLRQAAVRACRHQRRKRRRQLTFSEAFDEPGPPALASDEPGPERGLARDELALEVRRALAQLSPSHREVVVMHYYQELALQDMAAALGVAVGTVKSRLARARDRLEVLLRPYLEPPREGDVRAEG